MNGILFCFFVFETGPYCVFLAGLELAASASRELLLKVGVHYHDQPKDVDIQETHSALKDK